MNMFFLYKNNFLIPVVFYPTKLKKWPKKHTLYESTDMTYMKM